MSLSLSYTLSSTHWAVCTLNIDGAEAYMQAHYQSDAFNDLVGATRNLVANGSAEKLAFHDLPDTYHWQLTPFDERLRVQISRSDKWLAREDDPSCYLYLDADCRLRTFGGAVYAAGQKLLKDHGEEGYEAMWGHPSPSAAFSGLQEALRKAR